MGVVCGLKKGVVTPINQPFPNNTLIYIPSQLKEQYYDDTFRRISSSISNKSDRFILGKDYQWKRIQEMQKDSHVCSNISHTDVVQGCIQNQYLLDALRIVANMQNIIEKLFKLEYQHFGRYEILINTLGVWKAQTIDDFFPYQNGKLLFAHNQSNQLWVQLIEKVFAKLYGNYEKLERIGNFFEVVKDLTGAPYIKIKLIEVQMSTNYCYLQNQNIYKIESTHKLKNLVNDQITKLDDPEFVYYIPFNPDYYQITYFINEINQNEFHRDVIYIKVEENCHTFLTLSQSDLKFSDNMYYAQLSMIIGQLQNQIIIANKYDQVRDLTVECNLEIGQYLIYYEVYWQKFTDCKLSLQSYGSKKVQFQKSSIPETQKSLILDQLIILHSKTQNKQIYDTMVSRTESQIGRYHYIIYNNDSNDGLLKSTLQILKHQVGVTNMEHELQPLEITVSPNSQQILKFVVKLENEDIHKFQVTEKGHTLKYPLSDEELIQQAIQNPSNVHKRNNIAIYEYKSSDVCALVYVNESPQQYTEKLELTLNNLQYKGKSGTVVLEVLLELQQKYLIRLNVIDRQKRFFEFKSKSQFI